jgi:hypothetical protein
MPTDEELQAVGNYVTNYLAVADTLTKEQAYLKGIAESLLGTQEDRYAAAAAAAAIGIQQIQLASAHDTFMRTLDKSAAAPSIAQVQKSTELTQALAATIRSTVKAGILIDVVTKFVADWTALTKAPAPAPPP